MAFLLFFCVAEEMDLIMDYNLLADLLFPNVNMTAEQIEKKYPLRELPQGAFVTRFAPSPTGFMHLGNLYGALIDERLAHRSGGIFYLRIEDTDQKREIEGAVDMILKVLSDFGVKFDEGAVADGDKGAYGPYRQRQRADIYKVFAKKLVMEGKAYPCFCTEEELTAMREKQSAQKENIGYYGKWARHRDIRIEDIKRELAAGKPYVLRFRSDGNNKNIVQFNDIVRGRMEFPENDQDHIILKSDGIPTYHFAHIIDDHLMRTTHVVRGEEWLATLPVHLQFFKALNWQPPLYIHTPSVMKQDGASKRKLSKRKDPEAALSFYKLQGYPALSLIEYLMTLLNSNYEDWRLKNPTLPYTDFPFRAEKISASGALFDIAKLRDVSKNAIASMNAETVTEQIINWAYEFDREYYNLISRSKEYGKSIFAIGRGIEKPRKDLACFNEAKAYSDFFFDEIFNPQNVYPENISVSDRREMLAQYSKIYNPDDEQQIWFDKIKELASNLGFAPETKLYKSNPENYKGHIGDVSMVLRVAITGRTNSPDLYCVMKILGQKRVIERLQRALNI